MIKNMGEDRVIISLTEDELLDSIANFKALKPMMQDIVRKANGSDTKQGTKDAVELGHDFDVAIEAMTMLVVNIQKERNLEGRVKKMESHWNLTQPEWWKISESVKNFLKELKEIRIKRRIQKIVIRVNAICTLKMYVYVAFRKL